MVNRSFDILFLLRRNGRKVIFANVDASKALWKALGIPEGDSGNYGITWSDA
ncbi:hypothetical protein RND71_025500 [Anisodus tanguticus]|uniref:Uncharacterized protein n=1 Tax=Anisodus tanguticus TaxID=243964 RepID=A0AAE1VCR1_9SOLA|nr:hypothetical protein RND71_025500 [Anisodus tanguticus]